MKTRLLFTGLVMLGITTQAQVTRLNSNNSLRSGFPMVNGKAILVSESDSTLWVTDASVGGTFQLPAAPG